MAAPKKATAPTFERMVTGTPVNFRDEDGVLWSAQSYIVDEDGTVETETTRIEEAP
jgi:hypothetical protein